MSKKIIVTRIQLQVKKYNSIMQHNKATRQIQRKQYLSNTIHMVKPQKYLHATVIAIVKTSIGCNSKTTSQCSFIKTQTM